MQHMMSSNPTSSPLCTRWKSRIHHAQNVDEMLILSYALIPIILVSETGIADRRWTLARVNRASNIQEPQSTAKYLENAVIFALLSRIYRTGCQTSCQMVRQAFHLTDLNMQPNPADQAGPTRLLALDKLARSVGVDNIYVKDESTRLGTK